MECNNISFSKTKSYPIFGLIFAVIMFALLSASECQAVTLTITANNGSVTATPDKADYNIGEVVELIPRPDTGYCFTGWAGDAHGRRLVLNLTMDSDKAITANFDAWQPPIGIPTPSFGIEETYRMYDVVENRGDYTYYESPGDGYYTHYIDNTDEDCTDVDNPYGTVDLPRETLPFQSTKTPITQSLWLQPGAVMEVHGGPYVYPGNVHPDYSGPSVYSNATEAKPAFIRGVDSPTMGEFMWFARGNYLIIEGFQFNTTQIWPWSVSSGLPVLNPQYISIRSNNFTGGYVAPAFSAIKTVGSSGGIVNHIVIYDNEISYYGQWDHEYMESGDDVLDTMGVIVGTKSEYIWILDNHIHHNGGDSIHVGNSADRTSRYIYIGRNHMHDDRENAVDIKEAQDVIISQNTMHGYRELGRNDDGTICHTHLGNMAANTCPYHVWWIFNEMYDASYAGHSGLSGDEIYFIGNIVHDIPPEVPDADIHSKMFVCSGFTSTERHYYIGNTMYNVEAGIIYTIGSSNASILVANNIFNTLSEGVDSYWKKHIWMDENPDTATLYNNLFYQTGTDALIAWDNTTYTLAQFQSAYPANGLGCIEGDPKFIDVENDNVHLQSTSPAIHAGKSSGAVEDAYDQFETLYGIDIRMDIEGKPRTGAWDIGAYEYILNAVTDLAVSGTSQNSVTSSWTMPSDDGLASMPSRYDIRYATSLLTEDNWDTATQVQGEPIPGDFGDGQSFTITGLNPGTPYYIAIKTSNETGSTTSPLSNVISGTTATTGNHAPVLALIGDKPAIENELLTFTINATDADAGDTMTYSATNTPPDASFNKTTHTFEWTPMDSQHGTYHVTFQVSDSYITVSETITITVTGVLPTLTISSTIGGSTIPSGGSHSYNGGTPVHIQATPTANYHFVSWTGDLSGSSNPATIIMNSDKSVTANFAVDQHTLTTSSTSGGSVSTPGEGPFLYNHGTGVSIQATAGGSSYFVSWTGTAVAADKVANPNSAGTTVTVDADYAIQALFGESDGIAPTVTNCLPSDDDIQVPLNSLITLHVTDTLGVAAGSVTITLDGDTIYTGDTSEYSSANGICRRAGTPANYTYAYQSSQVFDFDQSKTVTVNAADLAGNVMTELSYSFTTEMRSFGQNKQVSLGLNNLNSSKPKTLCDSSGNIWAVWHAGPVGSRNIYVGKLAAGADAFGSSVPIRSNNSDQANPAIALGTDDKLYVVWQDNRQEDDNNQGEWDIYISTSVGGIDWSEERRVNDPNEDNQVNPAIIIDGQTPNYAHVAWQDDRSGNQYICIATSSDSFVTKTVSQVTSHASNQTTPAIAVDSANTVYVLWTDDRNASNDIYGAASSGWTNVAIVTKAASQSSPAIAVESTGSILHMLWVDQTAGNSGIYYDSSNGLSGSLTGTNIIDDDAVGKGQFSPAIAVTGSTGDNLQVFTCWHDERNISDNTGDTDLYMVQTNSGVGINVFVGDGGTNSDQIEPAMSIDQYGYPYLVWADDRSTNMEIYFAGSIFMQPSALVSALTTASSGGTVGTDPGSITGVDDASVVLPAGACPYDATISITKIDNQSEYGSLPCLNGYDFGPSGITFNTPVTITIPYAVTGAAGTSTVYWYDSRSWYNPLSQQGITNIERIVITPSLHALRFKTTHFTPFYVVLGTATDTVTDTISISDSGGGGGGGCSLSHSQDGSILEYFLPYGALALFMFILKRRDRRYRKDFGKTPLS